MKQQKERIQKLITFSPQLHNTINQKAEKLGLSFPEYLRLLAVNDIKAEVEKLPMVDKETENRIDKSLKDFEKGNYSVVNDNGGLKKYLKNLKK